MNHGRILTGRNIKRVAEGCQVDRDRRLLGAAASNNVRGDMVEDKWYAWTLHEPLNGERFVLGPEEKSFAWFESLTPFRIGQVIIMTFIFEEIPGLSERTINQMGEEIW